MTKTHCQSGRFQRVAVSDGWPHLNVAFYGNWSRVRVKTGQG